MSSAASRNSKPFLSLREGTFRLGDRLVFAKTNWLFQTHEQWAIVGPNTGSDPEGAEVEGWAGAGGSALEHREFQDLDLFAENDADDVLFKGDIERRAFLIVLPHFMAVARVDPAHAQIG